MIKLISHLRKYFCRHEYYQKEQIESLKAENERLQSELNKYDPFYFCSYSGCEAASFQCWRKCPNSVYNRTRAEAIKELTERFENELTEIEEIYIEEEHENFISANKVIALLVNLAKEMMDED